jgi:AraC-like DNA-binding protein
MLLEDLLKPYELLRDDYLSLWGWNLALCDRDGVVISEDNQSTVFPDPQTASLAIDEAERWGGPSLLQLDDTRVVWGLPIHDNQQRIAGLISEIVPLSNETVILQRMHQSVDALLELGKQYNLINASLLQLHQLEKDRERQKAEAIHFTKALHRKDFRQIYIREEPRLINCIRLGDRQEARERLNRILVSVFHLGKPRMELLKSYLLELLAMMSRAAIETGANGEAIWGLNFGILQELGDIDDEEALSSYLVQRLESLMDEIRHQSEHPNHSLMQKARDYMESHLHLPLKREDVARHAGFSESHFAHLMTTIFRQSFRELLTDLRIDRARILLKTTPSPLSEVALNCGFSDQSHFSRVFAKITGSSPREYRKQA